VPSALRPLQLRSSRAHSDRKPAVEVQQCPLRAEVGEEIREELARRKWRQRWWRRRTRRKRRRRRTTLIKSNNPHLAGGELRKVSSVKLLPAEAPLLSQPPLNIAANPLKRLSTELDRTGASWLQVMPQRRGESLVTDTAACWRVKEQGSLVIPFRSPCGVLMVPW